VLPLVLATLLVGASACSGTSSEETRRVDAVPGAGAQHGSVPTSIVQLGDSIASGEGTLYGYTYDASSREWTGGNVNVTWPEPYPACHVSPDAYGNHIAKSYGAAFHQFACSGATFASGIAAPEVDGGTTRRPAEFGDWATKQNLNAEYDAANPDLVLVTLGADDVVFSDIIEECIKNGYAHYFHLENLECVEGNPGATIKKDFFDFIPTLKQNYATLVSWIEARARANGASPPKVVFTNYVDPLPDKGADCPDVSWLYGKQVQYLATLLAQMNQLIVSTIEGLNEKNVAVADISKAYEPSGVDHRWCTDDPWAYGLSIYRFTDPSSFFSLAPFHPTPDGQESIAEHVLPTIADLFKSALPIEQPTTTTTGPTTTTTSAPRPASTTSTQPPAPATTTSDPTTTTATSGGP